MGHNTTASHLIQVMRRSFCRTAIPDILWSTMAHSLHPNYFKTSPSSGVSFIGLHHPHYPQSNGKIEATVKSMKKIIATSWHGRLLDEDKLCHALLQYRNTPSRMDTLSPPQKLYGRPLQDTIPVHRQSFSPDWQKQMDEVDTRRNSGIAKHTEILQSAHQASSRHQNRLQCSPPAPSN